MKIIHSPTELSRWVQSIQRTGKTIGFVPTMGALHEGHLSLIRAASSENDRVVVSIFVNPIQFDRPSDLKSYPRPLKQDIRLAKAAGADCVFAPSLASMYPQGFQTFVEVKNLSRHWEGRSRPGHFQGVATVVTQLFHLVQPTIAYFGFKDAQQARIVEQMVKDLHFPLKVKVLPTVREPDGLAMSSRNRLLTQSARRRSRILFEALQEARRLIQSGERRGSVVVRRISQRIRRAKGVRIDYVAIADPQTLNTVSTIRGPVLGLLAAWFGKVRLLDGMILYPRKRRR